MSQTIQIISVADWIAGLQLCPSSRATKWGDLTTDMIAEQPGGYFGVIPTTQKILLEAGDKTAKHAVVTVSGSNCRSRS